MRPLRVVACEPVRAPAREKQTRECRFVGVPVLSVLEGISSLYVGGVRSRSYLGFDRLRHPLMRDTPDRFFIGRSMCQRNNRFYRAANRREIAVRSELAIMDLKVLVRYYAR